MSHRLRFARCSLILAFAWVFNAEPLAAQQPTPVRLRTATWVTAAEFNRVNSIRELADGSLLVAAQGDNLLVHITAGAQEGSQILRTGNGPGEYVAVGWLYQLAADSTMFTDSYSSRWNVLRGTRFVDSHFEGRALNQILQARLSGADRFGRIAGVRGYRWQEGVPQLAEGADSLLVLLADRTGESIDTIARVRGAGGGGFTAIPGRDGNPGRMLFARPLAAADHALLTPDGWIAIAYVDPYRVDWRSPDGRWVRGRPLPFERIRVNRAERCAATRRLTPSWPCGDETEAGWPEFVPPFLPFWRATANPTLLSDHSGRLVVARTQTSTSRSQRYDVIDRTGRLVGILDLPLAEVVIGFGEKSIYIRFNDDDDLQGIRRHPWP